MDKIRRGATFRHGNHRICSTGVGLGSDRVADLGEDPDPNDLQTDHFVGCRDRPGLAPTACLRRRGKRRPDPEDPLKNFGRLAVLGMIKLQIDWTPRPPTEQVTSYDVQLTRDGVAQPIQSVTEPRLSLIDPQPGIYTAKVRANNVAGSGLWSNVSQGPSVPGTPPAPTITTVVE